MPAKRRTGGLGSPKSDDNRNNDQAYKLKRKRNNDAVKKTRAKTKQTAEERKANVEKLRIDNAKLEVQIEERKANVVKLKELLLHKVDREQHDQIIKKILDDSTDAEED